MQPPNRYGRFVRPPALPAVMLVLWTAPLVAASVVVAGSQPELILLWTAVLSAVFVAAILCSDDELGIVKAADPFAAAVAWPPSTIADGPSMTLVRRLRAAAGLWLCTYLAVLVAEVATGGIGLATAVTVSFFLAAAVLTLRQSRERRRDERLTGRELWESHLGPRAVKRRFAWRPSES